MSNPSSLFKRVSDVSQRSQRSSVPQLLQSLDKTAREYKSALQLELLSERKRQLRIKRSLESHQIYQPTMGFLKFPNKFSTQQSIDKGDPYVEMRRKKNLIVPQRAFQKIPNMRVNPTHIQVFSYNKVDEDEKVKRLKFLEYSRRKATLLKMHDQILDEQDGRKKKQYIERMKKYKKNMKIPMKKTFFNKAPGDEYNFFAEKSPHGNSLRTDTLDSSPRASSHMHHSKLFDLTAVQRVRTKQLRLRDITQLITESSTLEPLSMYNP